MEDNLDFELLPNGRIIVRELVTQEDSDEEAPCPECGYFEGQHPNWCRNFEPDTDAAPMPQPDWRYVDRRREVKRRDQARRTARRWKRSSKYAA